MASGRFWIGTGACVAAVCAAVLWVAPTLHGQVFVSRSGDGDRTVVRDVQVVGGRGSSIGVTVRDVDDADVTSQKLPNRRGALIDRVNDDSPAARAGLRSGDVVVGFDGEQVRSARQFARVVEETPAGRPAKASVLRGGSTLELSVTPAMDAAPMTWFQGRGAGPRWEGRTLDVPAMPELQELERMPELVDRFGVAEGPGLLGVSVQSMTEELAAHFGAKHGVLVGSVRSDSPAARAGVKVGDVIASVNGKAVADPAELRRLLRDAEQAEVALGLVRDRKPQSVNATLERPERQSTKRTWTV